MRLIFVVRKYFVVFVISTWCLYTDYSYAVIDTLKFSRQCSHNNDMQTEGCLKSGPSADSDDESVSEDVVEVPVSQCRYANQSMIAEEECAFAIKCVVKDTDHSLEEWIAFASDPIQFTIYGACTTGSASCPFTALDCLENIIYQAVYYRSGYVSSVVSMELIRSNHITYITD